MGDETNGMSGTGRMRAWVANGGKKQLGKVAGLNALSVGIVISVMQMFPKAVPGYIEAMNASAKIDTVVASSVKIDSMEKRLDKVEAKQDQGNVWLLQLLSKQGLQPIMLPVSDSIPADSSKTRPR